MADIETIAIKIRKIVGTKNQTKIHYRILPHNSYAGKSSVWQWKFFKEVSVEYGASILYYKCKHVQILHGVALVFTIPRNFDKKGLTYVLQNKLGLAFFTFLLLI